MKRKFNLAKTLTLIVLCLYALSMILLLAWMAMTSLKPRRNWDNDLNYLGWPSKLTLDNYKTIFQQFYVTDPFRPGEKIGVLSQIYNSVQYALIGGCLTALSPLLVAYVCSRFDFKFNRCEMHFSEDCRYTLSYLPYDACIDMFVLRRFKLVFKL